MMTKVRWVAVLTVSWFFWAWASLGGCEQPLGPLVNFRSAGCSFLQSSLDHEGSMCWSSHCSGWSLQNGPVVTPVFNLPTPRPHFIFSVGAPWMAAGIGSGTPVTQDNEWIDGCSHTGGPHFQPSNTTTWKRSENNSKCMLIGKMKNWRWCFIWTNIMLLKYSCVRQTRRPRPATSSSDKEVSITTTHPKRKRFHFQSRGVRVPLLSDNNKGWTQWRQAV